MVAYEKWYQPPGFRVRTVCKRVQSDESNGIIPCTVKRGTKRARHHVMSRPSVVSTACDAVVLKVNSLKKLQEIFGKQINYFTLLIIVTNFCCIYYVEGYHVCRYYKSPGNGTDGPSSTHPLFQIKCDVNNYITFEFSPTAQQVRVIATNEQVVYSPDYEECPPSPSFHGTVENSTNSNRRRSPIAIILPRYEICEYSHDLRGILQGLLLASGDFEKV